MATLRFGKTVGEGIIANIAGIAVVQLPAGHGVGLGSSIVASRGFALARVSPRYAQDVNEPEQGQSPVVDRPCFSTIILQLSLLTS